MRIPACELGLADFFRRQIESLETSSQDAHMIPKLVGNLHSLKADGDDDSDGIDVNVLGITVFGDESENLIPKHCRLLWKWAKPHSQYRKAGFWGHSLTQVLVDAEWNAGKGVFILVKAVEEEEFARVLRGEMKT